MERDIKKPVDNLVNELRLLILSYCDFQSAIRLMQTTKAWYECSKITHVWKQIYLSTFAEFNPKPESKDWKEEIKMKINMYGLDFEKFRHLLGNVKISFNIDPPIDLKEKANHLHRTLKLEVNGNLLPCMGYFGPTDVCFGDWIREVFEPLFETFDLGNTSHSWDFCDQGMPAFDFVKEGQICKLSIVEGICSSGADQEWQDWQNVEFLIEDLRAEYIKFLEELYEELISKYGDVGQAFWDSLKIKQGKKNKKKKRT